jgi:acyl carrier protein
MPLFKSVLLLLDEVLSLGGRASNMTPASPLLGAVPGLDSMAVVNLVERIETQFGIELDDEEIDGSTFATVGTLSNFIKAKVEA